MIDEAYENEHHALERVTKLREQLFQPSLVIPDLDIMYHQAVNVFKVTQVLTRALLVEWLQAVVPLVPKSSEATASRQLYPILTGQETDCLFRGVGDCKRGDN